MDNQHKKITGYRDLSQEEIDSMNEAKELASKVGDFIEKLKGIESIDKKWLEVGAIDLQKGFMSTVRSIAQPTTF